MNSDFSEWTHTYECKINMDKFSTKHLIKFREIYQNGKNYCICPHIKRPYKVHRDELSIEFISGVGLQEN